MKKIGTKLALAVALSGGVFLGMAAIGVSQPDSKVALPPPVTHSPSDLSLAFREVSEKVLPAVVSISTESRPREMAGNMGGQQLSPQQEEMFRRFFGDDERFQDMFRNPRMTPRRQMGSGSGFIVHPDGVILTNSHVVEGADRVTVRLSDGREIEAKSWNFDPRSDVAVVRIETSEDLPFVSLGESDGMEIGDWVLALGNPLNVGTTVTAGIVSATGRAPGINEREDYIQTDAAINPGNSGGPLVNLHGEVIGINTAISTRSGGYDGIGFAIPSNMVRWVADQLIEDGNVKRSYLGVQLQMLTSDLRSHLGLSLGEGALISEVFPETPAANAGLKPGDIVVEFAGQKIADRDSLVEIVEQSKPGQEYSVKVIREGKRQRIDVTLEEMPSDYTAALKRGMRQQPGATPAPENSEVSKLGLEIVELDSELASQLNLEGKVSGVLVKSVKSGSPAEESGLRAGDIIQRVGQKEVDSIDEFAAAIDGLSVSDGILVHIKRDRGSAFVLLKSND
ncbi:putative periplasmic serine endoprotease DegP-like precursor [Thalassoglobus neptunius]|uniref:Putative periplasmic serine endoprotease DegP-like n=1 Tax=Thalassoglobus neptunius TaxID=1938619 RepID=A0A5C5VYK1_9PLAN|nr:Do family serine endopeptidase [Thalassoglobus neptunius]TWT43033.1 putative periplasmic serine endoprotease DegP-like precursor [Thalassoglobus neptunius]